jgi:glycosyltransferase involved in cell wall biosynthesis
MPRVSVIINVWNGEATLAEAMDSALGQSFADFELLIWDDASTDSSRDIVARYQDPRIRYFPSDVKVSLGRARQQAINQAEGEWVAFLDQDDIWLRCKLELQLARAEQRPKAALIYGRAVRFYPNGRERDYDQAHEYAMLPEGNIFRELFTKSCFIAMSSAMFRRSALHEIGGVADWIGIVPDYYLYTAIAHRFPAAAVQQVVCRYRMHSGSTSQTTAVAMHDEALKLMEFWSTSVDAAVLRRCKRHHSTQIALAEMRTRGEFTRGLRRLMREGSVWSQLVRPAYFLFHIARRSVTRPYWKRVGRDGARTDCPTTSSG